MKNNTCLKIHPLKSLATKIPESGYVFERDPRFEPFVDKPFLDRLERWCRLRRCFDMNGPAYLLEIQNQPFRLDSTPLSEKISAIFPAGVFRSDADKKRFEQFAQGPSDHQVLLLCGASDAGPMGVEIGSLALAPNESPRRILPSRLPIGAGILAQAGTLERRETESEVIEMRRLINSALRGKYKLVFLLPSWPRLLQEMRGHVGVSVAALSDDAVFQCSGDCLPRVPLVPNLIATSQLLGQVVAASGGIDLFHRDGKVYCPRYLSRPMLAREFRGFISRAVCFYRGRSMPTGRVNRCMMSRTEASFVMTEAAFLSQLPALPSLTAFVGGEA